MKQTAVEWLVEVVAKMGYVSTELVEQAKEMEKEQHKKTWSEGMFCETGDIQAFEQYYNETLNQNKMKKETLEEAAEDYAVQFLLEDEQETDSANRKQAFKAGAKWQQEQMEKLKDFEYWKEWK